MAVLVDFEQKLFFVAQPWWVTFKTYKSFLKS